MPDTQDSLSKHDPYIALRYRDFRLLLTSRFLSTLGGQMVSVAIGWQIYARTHKAFALGLVGLIEIIPVLLFSLPAGHFSDHYSRQKISLLTRACLTLCSLALGLLALHQGPLWSLYGCILVIGITNAFAGPANSTLIAQVIPASLYANAVTWGSNSWQLAAALGPAAGGAIIALARSVTPVYFIDAAISLVYIGLIAAIRSQQPVRPRESMTWDSLAAGIRFLRQSPLLLSAITLDLFAVLLGGATALLPIFATDILHVGPTGFGWLRAAPSIGATSMALFLAHRRPFRRAGLTLLWAVAGFGAATIVFGLSHSFLLSLAMLLVLGALDNISVVVRSALLLVTAPDAMRGRVAAINSIFVGSSNELGAFESGAVASLFPAPLGSIISVVAGGIGTLVVVICCALIWPQLRDLGELRALEENEEND
jgi:MFS family permease